MKSVSRELNWASAAPLILAVLAEGDNYGYEICQKVKELGNDEIKQREVFIYPVLKKLENERMIRSYWKVQAGERTRKYYSLLERGRKQLEQNRDD